MKKHLSAFFLILIVGCDDEIDLTVDLPKVDKYSIRSMLYPMGVFPDTNKVRLLYDKENKISRRIGNLIPTNPFTGFSYRFYEDIADTIIYYKDSIVITKQLLSSVDFTQIHEYKRKLVLENDLIIKEIYFRDYYNENDYDTLLYSYNGQGQIDEITQIRSYSSRENRKFKYDDNGNLSLVTSERYKRGDIIYRDTLWFLDYDTSPNLTKNLNIFQECFYRSLSTNNFGKYIYKRYSVSDSSLVSTQERNWNLHMMKMATQYIKIFW